MFTIDCSCWKGFPRFKFMILIKSTHWHLIQTYKSLKHPHFILLANFPSSNIKLVCWSGGLPVVCHRLVDVLKCRWAKHPFKQVFNVSDWGVYYRIRQYSIVNYHSENSCSLVFCVSCFMRMCSRPLDKAHLD